MFSRNPIKTSIIILFKSIQTVRHGSKGRRKSWVPQHSREKYINIIIMANMTRRLHIRIILLYH